MLTLSDVIFYGLNSSIMFKSLIKKTIQDSCTKCGISIAINNLTACFLEEVLYALSEAFQILPELPLASCKAGRDGFKISF